MRTVKFQLRLTLAERQQLTAVAGQLQRTQGDTICLLIAAADVALRERPAPSAELGEALAASQVAGMLKPRKEMGADA